MLALQNILQQYPPKLHIFPKAILREYLQHLILKSIFSHPYASQLCFIGGTALRIAYSSQRFSEDLDFDNWWLTEKMFEEITAQVQKDLSLEGYEVEMKHIYEWAFHCTIKIPQLLFDNQLASMAREKLTIKIDTVAQGSNYIPQQKILQKFGIISPYSVAGIDVLLSMKLSAFFNRVKGRDIFDIVYLLWLGAKPDWGVCKHLFSIYDVVSLKKAMLVRIKELDLTVLQKDVQPFLFDSNDQSVVLFPQIIEQTMFG